MVERTQETSLEARVTSISTRLCTQLRTVFKEIPEATNRPTKLARALGVSNAIASRVLRATDEVDPIAAIHRLPGPDALRMLLRGAERHSVRKKLIASTRAAIGEFDQLVNVELGGQSELDTILSSLLPSTRRRFESGNKQLVYKGNRALFGVTVETQISASVMHPTDQPDLLKRLSVWGRVGFRRYRPGATLRLMHAALAPEDAGHERFLSLDGHLSEDGCTRLLLPQFCTKPLPEVESKRSGDRICHVLHVDGYGPGSAVTLYGSELPEALISRYRSSPEPRLTGASAEVEQPARLLIHDLLVHESVLPTSGPQLRIHQLTGLGAANPNDPSRDIDLLDLAELVEDLGVGIRRCRCAEAPEYVDVLGHCCEELGWEAERLHVFRCRIEYPLVGTQISIGLQFPYRSGG